MATEQKSWLVQCGDAISERVSNLFAHPYMQLGVILFCVTWFTLRLPTDLLTAALSILAITLSQMVLNRQNDREVEDRKRDIAMHAKLDELLHAKRGARDEMMGIEELEEEKIVQLKEEVKTAIDAEEAGVPGARTAAKAAVDEASDKVKANTRQRARVKAKV